MQVWPNPEKVRRRAKHFTIKAVLLAVAVALVPIALLVDWLVTRRSK